MKILMQAIDQGVKNKAEISGGAAKEVSLRDADRQSFKHTLDKARNGKKSVGKNEAAEKSNTNSDVSLNDGDVREDVAVAVDDGAVDEVESKEAGEVEETYIEGESDEHENESIEAAEAVVGIDESLVQQMKDVEQEPKVTVQDLQDIVKDVFGSQGVEVTVDTVGEVAAESGNQELAAEQAGQDILAEQVQAAGKVAEDSMNGIKSSGDFELQAATSEVKLSESLKEESRKSKVNVKSAGDAGLSKGQLQASEEVVQTQMPIETELQKQREVSVVGTMGREADETVLPSVDVAKQSSDLAEIKVDLNAVDGGAIRLDQHNMTTVKPNVEFKLIDSNADHEQMNTARIARGMQSALNQNGGNLTLRLTPPTMGTVRIELQIQGTNVNVQLHTEQDSARSMLSHQLSNLKHSLESQGLNVERIGVQNMQSSTQSNMNDQSDMSQSDGRSRGEYTEQQGQRNQEDSQQQQKQQNLFDDLMGEEFAA